MLEPHEKDAFDGLVAQLRAGDAKFGQRIDRLARPRRRMRVTVAALLFVIAPFCVVLGGWTGLIMAVVAVGYGASLLAKRDPMTGASGFAWWSKRPGASL